MRNDMNLGVACQGGEGVIREELLLVGNEPNKRLGADKEVDRRDSLADHHGTGYSPVCEA